MNCHDCKYFEYEEFWDGEEETRLYICHKGKELSGWFDESCEDFESDLVELNDRW